MSHFSITPERLFKGKSLNFIATIVFLLWGSLHLYAQTAIIKGKVILSNGKSAPFVNIWIPHTSNGTATDSSGNYKLTLDQTGKFELEISSMGYQAQHKTIIIDSLDEIYTVPITILQKSNETLATVEITAHPKMHIERNNGKLEVGVKNTQFEKSQNLWEGLKKVPLLQVTNQDEVKIFGKKTMVKINGVRTQMSGEALKSYLSSLDPESVKKIEMNPNPGVAYESQVAAYINIVLKDNVQNYHLSLQTTQGKHTDYYTQNRVNYALNKNKFNVYANYNFSYEPTQAKGTIKRSIGIEPINKFQNKMYTRPRKHQILVNFGWKPTHTNKIQFHNYFSYNRLYAFGEAKNQLWQQKTSMHNNDTRLILSQIWKHSFNDSVQLKIGGYEVFNHTQSQNFSHNSNHSTEKQRITSYIPIYVTFADYQNTYAWGTTSVGVKYRNIGTRDNNSEKMDSHKIFSPYRYTEKVWAAYLQHRLSLGSGSLQFGLRSESSKIDYRFDAQTEEQSFHNQLQFTNWLYSTQYNWRTKHKRMYNVAFRKKIRRPDYIALNPFNTIAQNLLYQKGDTKLVPEEDYLLSFSTYKNHWTFYGEIGDQKNRITRFFELDNNQMALTYRNFDHIYLAIAGTQYYSSLFNDVWDLKAGISLYYFKARDADYKHTDSPTPQFRFNTNSTIKLGHQLDVNVDYTWVSGSKLNIVEHHPTSRFDIALTKTWNPHFMLSFFVHDLFKTGRNGYNTLIPDFYYSNDMYPDTRSFGVSLKYTLTGQNYQKSKQYKVDDSSINRLK